MSVRIAIVVAMDTNGLIGRDNGLPWHLPADLQHFKQITMGRPILMGRKTHESIGRPLPGRTNIVITRDAGYQAAGCVVVNSIDAALQAAGEQDEIMVIGGAEFYRQVLPRTDTIYLTRIHETFTGDTFFPELSAADWREVERSDQAADASNPHDYSFIRLERVHHS
jgi:dihydrofolate reductase